MIAITIAVLIAPFVLLPLVVLVLGRQFLYHRTTVTQEEIDQCAAYGGWKTERVRVADGIEVVGLLRPPKNPDAPWLWFFGGNAMRIDRSYFLLDLIRGNNDWGLVVFAYRGYDTSDGAPSEVAITRDKRVLAAHLANKYGARPDRLVLVGESLGSGVSAHCAANLCQNGNPPAGLVLVSPYRSMADVFDDQVPIVPIGWVMPDAFRTNRLIDDITCPVMIIHGVDDQLISIDHGRDLARQFGAQARMVELSGLGHGEIWETTRSVHEIRRFVATVVPDVKLVAHDPKSTDMLAMASASIAGLAEYSEEDTQPLHAQSPETHTKK